MIRQEGPTAAHKPSPGLSLSSDETLLRPFVPFLSRGINSHGKCNTYSCLIMQNQAWFTFFNMLNEPRLGTPFIPMAYSSCVFGRHRGNSRPLGVLASSSTFFSCSSRLFCSFWITPPSSCSSSPFCVTVKSTTVVCGGSRSSAANVRPGIRAGKRLGCLVKTWDA